MAAEALADGLAPDLLDSTPYGELIASMSEANGVDPLLVRALIQVESNYKPKARSPRGAMGLMQLMPSTAKEYSVRNPFDPRTNIEAGIKHLKSLIDRFGVEIGAGGVQRRRRGGPEVQRDPAVPGDPRLRLEDSVARRAEVAVGQRVAHELPGPPGPTISPAVGAAPLSNHQIGASASGSTGI